MPSAESAPSPQPRRRGQSDKKKADSEPQRVALDSLSPQARHASQSKPSKSNVALAMPTGYNAVRDITTPTVNACIVKLENKSMSPHLRVLELADFLDAFMHDKIAELNGIPSFAGKHHSFEDCGNDLSFNNHAVSKFLLKCGEPECQLAFLKCAKIVVDEHRAKGVDATALFRSLGHQILLLSIMQSYALSLPATLELYTLQYPDFMQDSAQTAVIAWIVKQCICSSDSPSLAYAQEVWRQVCSPALYNSKAVDSFKTNAIDLASLILRKLQTSQQPISSTFFEHLVLAYARMESPDTPESIERHTRVQKLVNDIKEYILLQYTTSAHLYFGTILQTLDALSLTEDRLKQVASILCDFLMASPTSIDMMSHWSARYEGNIRVSRFMADQLMQKQGLLSGWRKIEHRSPRIWRASLLKMQQSHIALRSRKVWKNSEPHQHGLSKQELKNTESAVQTIVEASIPRVARKKSKGTRGRLCLWLRGYNAMLGILFLFVLWRVLAATSCPSNKVHLMDDADQTICRFRKIVVPPVQQAMHTIVNSHYARALKQVMRHPLETLVVTTGLFEIFTEFGDTYEDIQTEFLVPLVERVNQSPVIVKARKLYEEKVDTHYRNQISNYAHQTSTAVVHGWRQYAWPGIISTTTFTALAVVEVAHASSWFFTEHIIPAAHSLVRRVVIFHKHQLVPTISSYASQLSKPEVYMEHVQLYSSIARGYYDRLCHEVSTLISSVKNATVTVVPPKTKKPTSTKKQPQVSYQRNHDQDQPISPVKSSSSKNNKKEQRSNS